jgi:hypothetical protein
MINLDSLKKMLDNATNNQIPGTTNSITSVEETQGDIREQIETTDQIMAQTTSEMREYLELTKLPQFPRARITYGSAFGVLELNNWVFWEPGPDEDPQPIYLYCMPGGIPLFPSGKNWDSDQKILQLDGEFACAYDLKHKAVDSTSTYGLVDMDSKLESAKSLLNNNLSKYTDIVNKFTRFLPL